jgi:hypothetical protein
MDKPGLKLEIGFGDFEHLVASLFAFSATFEICRNDRICRHEQMPNSGRERDSLIRVKISLIAKFNSLQGRKNSLFGCVGNWPVRY